MTHSSPDPSDAQPSISHRRAHLRPLGRRVAARVLAALLAAGATFAGAQTPEPEPANVPAMESAPLEPAPAGGEQLRSKAVLLDGSIALTEGARSPRWNVREENAGTEIYFEGDIHGPEARLTLRVWASGGSVGDYSVTVRSTAGPGASSPFSVPIRVHGMVEAVEIGNDLGDPVTLRHLEIRGAYLPAPQEFNPPPAPMPPLSPTPGATPPPTASRVSPGPAPQPTPDRPIYPPAYGTPYPPQGNQPPPDAPLYPAPYVNGAPGPHPTPYPAPFPNTPPRPAATPVLPERVTLFNGELKLSEGSKSRWFELDPKRHVGSVEVTWANHWFANARGALYVNGENTTAFPEKAIGGSRSDSFLVNRTLRTLALGATKDTVKLRRVVVVYDGLARPEPARPAAPAARPPEGAAGEFLEFREIFVEENGDYVVELPERLFVRQVELLWNDRGEGAVGHVTTDLEPMMGTPGKRVSGGDSDRATFPIGRVASRLKLHARHADIQVIWMRVYVAKK